MDNNSEPKIYSSLQEWKTKNFPKWNKDKELKKLQNNPEALGKAIANHIFSEIHFEIPLEFQIGLKTKVSY